MKYNTKFVIKGQVNNDDKIVFTYPKPFDSVHYSSEDEWLKSLPETRVARNFDSDKVYVYWKNEYGNYYSLIVPNALDPRGGKLMLTIFTEKYIVSSGKLVVDTLLKLGNVFGPIVENLRMGLSQEIIEALDNRLSVLEESYCKDSTYNGSAEKKYAYRFYSTQEELDNIMQFPNQEEYRVYKKILIVPSGSINSQLSSDFEEIKSKVKKTYRVSYDTPNSVSIDSDKRAFVEGESLKLIYHKDGYVGVPKEVTIDGNSNEYIRYEGTTLHLCSPDEAGVNFHRGLKLVFKSNKGIVPSEPVYITYNGQKVHHRSGKLFEFDDDRNIYELSISAKGYKNVEVSISIDEILRSSEKTITLYPEEKELRISLETDEGRKEGCVSMKVDDPLYKYLEKASRSGIPINRKKIDSYTREREENRDKQPSKQGFLESLWNYPIFLSVIKILVGILIAYFLYCAYVLSETNNYPWPFEKNKKENIENPSFDPVEKPTEDSIGEASSEGSNPEQEDIAYLKQQDIWTKDDIKSEKYQKLYVLISEGRIDDILNKQNSEWFPDQINRYWKDCYEILRAIKDKKNDEAKLSRAQEEMKSLSNEGSIPLIEMREALKRVDNPEVTQGNNTHGENGSKINGSGSKSNKTVGAPSTEKEGRPTSGR